MAHSAQLIAVGVVESEATDVFRGLPGVHADMEIMKDTFDDLGFLLPTILVDGTTRRPTVSNISRAFREFAAQNIKRDITVVYLSTHGHRVNGELYFVVADSRRSVGPPGDMETGTMLSSTQFQHLLSTHVRPHTKRLLVLIDTCHAGHDSTLPSKGTTTGPGGPVRTFDDYFGKVVAAEGMATVCACPGDSRTGISDEKGSTFTRLVRDAVEEVTKRSDPPGVVALLPFVLEIQRRAKQARYPAPVFSGAGICDLEDFFIGSRKAAAGIKATPKPTAFPVVVQQQFPITSRRSVAGGPLRDVSNTDGPSTTGSLRPAAGCGGLKRKANVTANSSRSPRSTPSKKRQKSAPLEPPQESCSCCGDPIVLKVTRSEKNKGKRYWSCQAHSREGHFFEWRVPGDLATRLSKPDLMQFAQAMGANPPKSANRERIVDHIKQIQYAQ